MSYGRPLVFASLLIVASALTIGKPHAAEQGISQLQADGKRQVADKDRRTKKRRVRRNQRQVRVNVPASQNYTNLPGTDRDRLIAAIEGRSDAHRARDGYRRPLGTLDFCGVESGDTVVELWPGGGWYTRILQPYLASGGGKLVAVHWPENTEVGYRKRLRSGFVKEFIEGDQPGEPIELLDFDEKDRRFGTKTKADHVLTFRNIHNWVANDNIDHLLSESHSVLKRGGSLCVIEHRAASGTDLQTMNETGYVTVKFMLELAKKHRFTLEASSLINANPRDTKDYQGGVWSLPPSLRHGEKDRQKYMEIGESDRMTLRFTKK